MTPSIFDQLIEAIRGYQTGVVHIRSIMAPLFAEATKDDECLAFYTQAQGDPLGYSQIETCCANDGLPMPENPGVVLDFVVSPVGDGVAAPTTTDDSTLYASQEAAAAAAAAAQ